MLAAGLAGGFGHCVGMCGPIVAAFSMGNSRPGLLHLLLYNLGRVMTYSILGALVGATGSLLALTSVIDPLQKGVMALTGFCIVLMGLVSGGWIPFGRNLFSCSPAMPAIRRAIELFSGPRTTGAWFPMGLLLGFLPCGLTYTVLLTAARSAMDAPDRFAGMARGSLMMLLFGFGTTPALLLVGKASALFGDQAQRRFYRLASLIMIATGIWYIAGAFRI